MRKANAKLLGGRGGKTAIEYSLIASLVAVMIVGGLQTVGPSLARAVSHAPARIAAAP
jgi:Flp pilus assembly pilin Flp